MSSGDRGHSVAREFRVHRVCTASSSPDAMHATLLAFVLPIASGFVVAPLRPTPPARVSAVEMGVPGVVKLAVGVGAVGGAGYFGLKKIRQKQDTKEATAGRAALAGMKGLDDLKEMNLDEPKDEECIVKGVACQMCCQCASAHFSHHPPRPPPAPARRRLEAVHEAGRAQVVLQHDHEEDDVDCPRRVQGAASTRTRIACLQHSEGRAKQLCHTLRSQCQLR